MARRLSATRLDVSVICATVIAVTDKPEEKYHWIVLFRPGTWPYLYKYRTLSEMAATFKIQYEKYGNYPLKVWALVKDELREVEITD